MNPISILIAEDFTLLRDTWKFLFDNDPRFKVIAVTCNGEEAVILAKQLLPDIILMDINLPGISGIKATELIKKCSPSSKILAVSFHNHPEYAQNMIKQGAMGYLTKNSSMAEMFKAILEIYNGNKYICEEIKQILSDQLCAEQTQTGLKRLSKRELEIIESMKTGASSKEIAAAMKISTKTVEVHRYNILGKLNLPNSAALINYVNRYQFS